ncbi:multidrug efflux SMR transporter [Lactobacillus rodentium]|uniref:Small multidrug resistance protein n=1 Tax=Lactobacillus rodentium TaxID=947835 RepID=A0A2Z6TFB7_9LACO|nr:multidrug efflux SMR transporter [Lactobacillus rodentium]MCR1894577.1 multidrug efflux SMR transporter [Lactobacillus rodentium]GBG04950.1 small multidrug resistance protein [Lactobacillus rodentium]
MGYIELAIAIVAEVIGTNFMKASVGFTKLIPAVATIISYIICFYTLSLSLKTLNLSVAYATWGGVGIILTTIVGVMYWKQEVNIPQLIGIGLIVIGVVVTNMFSEGH